MPTLFTTPETKRDRGIMTSFTLGRDALVEIDSMARRSGRSRSAMLRELLNVGLKEARRQLRHLEEKGSR